MDTASRLRTLVFLSLVAVNAVLYILRYLAVAVTSPSGSILKGGGCQQHIRWETHPAATYRRGRTSELQREDGANRSMFIELFPWEKLSISYPDPNATVEMESIKEKLRSPSIKKGDASTLEKRLMSLKERYLGGTCRHPFPMDANDGSCCLGSASTAGAVKYMPSACNKAEEPYSRVREHAISELRKTETLLENSYNCDVCQIVDIISQHNLSMAFLGDSLTAQTFQGLECELRRRAYNVTKTISAADRPTDLHWKYGLRSTSTIIIELPQDDEPVEIQYYSMYLPNSGNNMSEIYDIAKGHDVFVFNFGLHVGEYQRPKQMHWHQRYEALNHRILTQLKRLQFTLLAHRETAAQHYEADGGSYYLAAKKLAVTNALKGLPNLPISEKSLECVPMQEGSEVGWREPIVKAVAEERGYRIVHADESIISYPDNIGLPELVILPFFNFTKEHHKLHSGECTHWCSTPFLWLPLWRSLRLALERKVTQLLHESNHFSQC